MLASEFDNVDILYLVFQFVKSDQYLKMSMYKILENLLKIPKLSFYINHVNQWSTASIA